MKVIDAREVTTPRRSLPKVIVVCPFHAERTGSCALNADTERWHCFGCGKSGGLSQVGSESWRLEVWDEAA